MKIATVKKRFKNMWVLAEVVKENKLNQPVEINPIMASNDRNKVYERIASLPKGTHVATFYTGKISGTFIFNVNIKI